GIVADLQRGGTPVSKAHLGVLSSGQLAKSRVEGGAQERRVGVRCGPGQPRQKATPAGQKVFKYVMPPPPAAGIGATVETLPRDSVSTSRTVMWPRIAR